MTEAEAEQFIYDLIKGHLDEKTILEELIALSERGETIEEITGMARGLLNLMKPIELSHSLLDTCGTGGSGLSRINTSTLCAFVLSAGGVPIAKHGNKAMAGRCGSFDVLEALDIPIELDGEKSKRCLQEINLAFLYAPLFHPAFKTLAPIRKKIEKRTIFNLLGPLLNPARVDHHLLGTGELATGKKLIQVMKNLGLRRALVVVGSDGLDEITLTGPTTLLELKENRILERQITPEECGFKSVPFEAIAGGSISENAERFENILNDKTETAYHDLVALNAGAGFYLMNRATSIAEGAKKASELLKNGHAINQFNHYKTFSQSLT